MFEPEIVWHYYGRLRHVLLNAACPDLVPTLRRDDGPRVVLIPTTYQRPVHDLVRSAQLGHYLRIESGTAKSLTQYLKASDDQVIWLPHSGAADLSGECDHLERIARKRRRSCVVLPVPGLAASEVLHLVNAAPSALLDGSHPSERRLSEYLARVPEPLGPLVADAWRELQGTKDLSLMSRTAFEERLAQLHPSVVEAPLWSAVVDLWRTILRGMAEDRVFAQRWIQGIEAWTDGLVGLDKLSDILLYEGSIFASHALKDPSCLSYPAVVHGQWWVMGRYAAATVFGSTFGPSSSGHGGSIFEAI